MLSQPGRWWVGLIIPIALWIAAVHQQQGPIEHVLSGAVTAALTRSGDEWAMPEAVRGRDVVLRGAASDDDSLARAARIAERVDGVRRSDGSALRLLPEVKPYVLTIARSADSVTFEGAVPSANVRKLLVAGAAAAGLKIEDRLTPARGAPDGFLAVAQLGLDQLLRLDQGNMRLADRNLALTGQAIGFDSLAAVPAALRGLPAGFVLGDVKIAPPQVTPFLWSATLNGNVLTLGGYTPTEGAKADLIARARAQFPTLTVTDASRLASGVLQGDWSAAAAQALGGLAGLANGRAILDGARISVTGTLRLGAAAAPRPAAPQGFSIGDWSIEPPAVAPYVLTLARQADGISAFGFAPGDDARAELATRLARELNRPVQSRLQVAVGLPANIDYAAVTEFMTEILGTLETGEVALVDRGISVAGRAADQPARERVLAMLRSRLPAGVELRGETISVAEPAPVPPAAAPADPNAPTSPYVWQARHEPGVVTLEGFVPDAVSRKEIGDFVNRRFQGERLDDQMREAVGAPRAFVDAVSLALDQLARLGIGTVSISDRSIKVEGETLLAQAAPKIRDALGTLPAGWSADANIAPAAAVPPVAAVECQTLLNGLTERGRIYFRSGSDEIDKDANGLLDRLTAAARRCPETAIEVDGHTDNDGSIAFNRDLSERRAFAVINYMIQNGNIDSRRLTAVGFGMSQPIAPNDDEAGKARNRRIEFKVK